MTCNTINSNAYSVHLHKQDACGTIAENPAFKKFRRVSGKARTTNNFTESTETKTSRQARKQILDSKEQGAELEFVLTEDLVTYLENALYGNFSILTTLNLTDVTLDDITDQITSVTGGFSALSDGQTVFVSVDSLGLNEGYHIAQVVNDNTIQLTAGSLGTVSGSGLTAVIKGSMLRSGNSKKYLAVQTRINDVAVETVYDALVNAISLTIGQTGEITGSLSMNAAKRVTGAFAGQLDLVEDTSDVLVSQSAMKYIILNHLVNTDAGVSDMTVELSNNISVTQRAGSLASNVIAESNITCTGSLNMVVSAASPTAEYLKYLNQDTFSITVPLVVDADANKLLYITLNNCTYTEQDQNDSGNEIVISSGTYAAQEDVYGTTIQIDKNF